MKEQKVFVLLALTSVTVNTQEKAKQFATSISQTSTIYFKGDVYGMR